jgi:hypothetical protein
VGTGEDPRRLGAVSRALRESLGLPAAIPEVPRVIVTRTLEGDGFRIENLVFESRPGLVVTANLYVPARATGSMPGILISHSHHAPRTQGELQEVGMTWARRGCLVLDLAVPLDVDPFPHLAEPLGGLLACFGALFEDDDRAVYVRGA